MQLSHDGVRAGAAQLLGRGLPAGDRDDEVGAEAATGGDALDGRRDRDDYAPRGVDRYASSGREDRYSSRGEDRRGGGGGGGGGYGYDREERGGDRGGDRGAAGGYGEKDTYGGGRSYDDRGQCSHLVHPKAQADLPLRLEALLIVQPAAPKEPIAP